MSNTEKKLACLESPQIVELPEGATPDTEALLLARLESSVTSEDYFRWLLFVVGFYRGINKADAAIQLLNDFIKSSKEPEHSAHCYLALGQIATDQQQHQSALEHFSAALEFAPKKRNVLYVLHNNIGFCFNSLGEFKQGERHCREAIAIDWTRASGYRNLGLSLNGQKDLKGAAWALAEAIKVDGSDDRARVLLEKLLALHSMLGIECPWIRSTLDADPSARPDSPMM
jgi:tetratricopeptide (TPR) repeat protein